MSEQQLAFRLSVNGQSQVTSALGAAEQSLGRLDAAQDRVSRSSVQASASLRSLAGTLAAGMSVKAIIDAADAVTTLENRLKLATGSAAQAATAYQELFRIAQSSRTSFTELGATFASISRAGQTLGLSQQRLLTVTEAIGNAMTISGGSAASMQAALQQLGQGLSSGTLRGEELNSVMEQAPRLAQALAEGLGVPIGELRKLGETGSLTSQQVITALEKAAPQLAKEVQGSTMTVGQAFTVLSNSTVKFVGEADKATGASATLAGTMQTLAKGIDSVGETIREHETAFAIIGGTLAGAAVAAGILAVGKALSVVAGAVGTLNVVLAANPAVLALLGIGAIAGGAAAAASAYSKTAAGVRETIETLEEANRRSEVALQRAAGRPAAQANIQATIDARKKQINDLKADLILLETPAVDNRHEDDRNQRGLQQLAERSAAEKALIDIRMKLAGVDASYLSTLKALSDARAAGAVDDKEYVALVSELAKQTYKAGDSAKAAKKDLEDQAKLIAQLGGLTSSFADEWSQLSKAYARGGISVDKLAELQGKLLAQQPAMRDSANTERKQREDLAELEQKQAEDQLKHIEQLKGEVRAQQERSAEIGLEGIALVAVRDARVRANIALLEEQAMMAELGGASPERLAYLHEEIRLKKQLADSTQTGGTKQAAQDALGKLGVGTQGIEQKLDLSSLKDAVAGLDGPLGSIVDRFQTMIDLQAKFGEQAKLIAAGKQGDAEQVAKALQEETRLAGQLEQARLSGYASMASAAKGFFEEGSRGYRVMAAAEKGFRALELANAAASAARQLGLIGEVTTAKVAGEVAKSSAVVAGQATETTAVTAGEAQRNAAKTPGVFMAFMSALGPWGMAAAGVAIAAVLGGAVGGGGGPAVDPGNTGTGTVLGDTTAQSESIAASIEALRDVDTMTMRYSAQMLDALRGIEDSIGGLSGLIVRSNGAGTAFTGLEGRNVSTQGRIEANAARAAAAYFSFGLTEVLGLGRTISNIVGKLNSVKTTIVAEGIYGKDQTLGSILSSGFDAQYYADVNTKKKRFGFTTSNKNGTVYSDQDTAELDRQFSQIFEGFADAVIAAAGPLDVSLGAVEQRLAGFVVNIGKIDIKGLTGTEIQEKLAAVFGAAGDRIAAEVLPGLEDFQLVGEGYLETVVRVATGVETAEIALDRLGVTAVSVASVVHKTGDIAAEVVRQSIALAEGATGIGKIVGLLDGSGAEIAQAYDALVGVRITLSAIGLAGDAVTTSLLRGAGGLTELQDAVDAFESNFLSDSERQAAQAARLTEEFRRLGLSLPASGAAFVQLVRGINTSTEAGQALLGSVLSLSDAFAQLDAAARETEQERLGLEQQLLGLLGNTTELRRRELEALDPSNRALQEQIWALQDQQSAAQAASQSLRDLGSRLQTLVNAGRSVSDYLGKLGQQTASPEATLATTRDAYIADLAAARKGDLNAYQRVTTSAEAYSQAAQSYWGSGSGMQAVLAQIRSELSALPEVQALDENLAALGRIEAKLGNIASSTDLTAASVGYIAEQREKGLLEVQATISAVLAADMPESLRRILMTQAGNYATTVNAVLSSSIPDELKAVLLNASTTASRAVQLSAALSSALTADQRALLYQVSEGVTKTVLAAAAGGSITADQRLLLERYNESVSKTVYALAAGGTLTADQRAILNASTGGASSSVKLSADVALTPNSATTEYLSQLRKLDALVLYGYMTTSFLQAMAWKLEGFSNQDGLKNIAATWVKWSDQGRFNVLGSASALGNAFVGGNLVTAFAKGGAFTNRVVDTPTMAPQALFGEAGPEAIMPLTRGPDGSLGVRNYEAHTGGSTPPMDPTQLLQEMMRQRAELERQTQELQALLVQNGAIAKEMLDELAAIRKRLAAIESTNRLAAL